MAIANHVIRRRAFYAWRRLWRGNAVQLPLSTMDPNHARRLAAAATAAASVGWPLLDAGRITLHDAKQEILRVVQQERLALDYEAAGGHPENSRPGVRAFYFFFNLAADGPDDEPEPNKKTNKAGSGTPDAATNYETPSRPADSSVSPPEAAFEVPEWTEAPKTAPRPPVSGPSKAKPLTAPAKTRDTPQTAPQGGAVRSTLIQDVVTRLGETDKRSGRASDKTIEQCAGIAALFVELIGIEDVRAIRQTHIADFVDGMDRIPPVYRRSAAEQQKPISQIIEEAEAARVKTGLSSATINRNLIQMAKILGYAKSQGLKIDPSLDPTQLRRFERKNAKDAKDPFTPEDVKKLFAAPVWAGSKSTKRRRTPGDVILKDWLYWVPLIAAYSGARREEICGLETADVEELDGIPVFRIRENGRRGVKTAQSERVIPVHSHLIELGFLDFVQDQRARSRINLFHDLKPKSPKSPIGDSISYLWGKIQDDQIGQQEKKSFHSFRHYAVQGLRAENPVEKHIRAELFGHLVGDIEDDRYGGRLPVATLRAAVEALPRVF